MVSKGLFGPWAVQTPFSVTAKGLFRPVGGPYPVVELAFLVELAFPRFHSQGVVRPVGGPYPVVELALARGLFGP